MDKKDKLQKSLEKNLPSKRPPAAKLQDKIDIKDDYEFSRKTYKDLIQTGMYSLDTLAELARESEHPRAFEVLSRAIKDVADTTEKLMDLQKNKKALAALIEKNVQIKVKVVQKDEFEKGDRKLLNFGHTLGHAIENEHALLHGHAISIGMVYAAKISQVLQDFNGVGLLVETLQKYGLPTAMHFDIDSAMELMQKDKKNVKAGMQYVLLNKMGRAVYETIPMKTLYKLIKLYS